MELVYIYDDKLAQDAEGNYYTGSAFSQEVFDRYLLLFDHIHLVMRKADVDPTDTEALGRMNRLDTNKIEVTLLPNPNTSIITYLDPRIHHEFKRIVEESISPDCATILRAPSASGTIAADYCQRHGIPYLAEAVGCPWDSLWNHSVKGKLFAPGAWLRFRRTMRNADYAVYVTNSFLQRRYPTNGKSLAVSDVELQETDASVLEERIKRIETRSRIVRIGTAGALNLAYKGQRYVIEALARLKAKGRTEFEYHLAGGGDDTVLRNAAHAYGVEKQVVFDGSIPHEEMFSWLDSLDIYIQPSTVESMPRALIEAMSRGLPALGSIVGDIPDLLDKDAMFARKNVRGIEGKLESITPEQMLLYSKSNYERAKLFQKQILEKKRAAFFSEFAKEATRNRQ